MRFFTPARVLSVLLATTSMVAPALAADNSAEIAEIRKQIEALRQDQARRIAEIQQQDAQINALTNALDRIEGKPASAPAVAATTVPVPSSTPAPVMTAAPPVTTASASALKVFGDFRLRYETNFGDESARNRNRGVLRGRLGATYQVLDWLSVGGRITTGDANDPNSADIDLSNFDNDFQVSLDQAYLVANFQNAQIMGGRMPNPFTRTELVWDNDVNPQGLTASYKLPVSNNAAFKATGMYFLIDEATGGPDADMAGAQVGFEFAPSSMWKAEIAAAYYDYAIRTTGTADTGDFRTNLVDATGRRYLSDFNLGDVVGSITYLGLGPQWPVKLTGDVVKNFGAFNAQDTGYSVDLAVGGASKPGDWRFGYGYSVAETDAVFAAFSHDNTGLATNYRQHTLTADYVPVKNVVLNATWYHYSMKDIAPGLPHDWLNRIRFNLMVNF